MATVDSDKVQKALMGKMKAERKGSGDWWYLVRNDDGIVVASTSLSRGSKQTLSSNRVSAMARQLRLNKAQLFVDLVSCTLNREDALKIMEDNS
jgi:hypothetical protein